MISPALAFPPGFQDAHFYQVLQDSSALSIRLLNDPGGLGRSEPPFPKDMIEEQQMIKAQRAPGLVLFHDKSHKAQVGLTAG